MTPDKVLCFELFGDYAQFRKFFTNMSPLSFSIPPRTVLAGIIGTMLGIPKDENPESFTLENSFMALRLINPVQKQRIAHNYLKTKSTTQIFAFDEHKPTNIEFLTDVRYRIYFSCVDAGRYQNLKTLLEAHKSIYSIALGISGCLANYVYKGEYRPQEIPADTPISLTSIIPMAAVKKLNMTQALKLQKQVLPICMKNDREVTLYEEILFEMDGKAMPLTLNTPSYQVESLNDVIHGF